MVEEIAKEVETALILPSANDSASEKLRKIKNVNLVERKRERLIEISNYFTRDFKRLSSFFLDVRADQLEAFSHDELAALEKIIFRKARFKIICWRLFIFGLPVIGWLSGFVHHLSTFGDDNIDISNEYLRERKYLIRNYGENFLSELLKTLKPEKEETP